MEDLVTWLREQLDEDERVAQAAHCESWSVEPYQPSEPGALPGSTWVVTGIGDTVAAVNGSYRADHLARHDPARVLREVEAKRRIVDSFAAGMEAAPLQRGTEGYAIVRMVLRLLVLPYSDRPGYKPEWQSLSRPRT